MTKIRCQICGGENLHTENATTIVCDDCGNRTVVIPESAITGVDAPDDSNLVTIQYDKSQTDCPRKTICLNDTMFPGEAPCRLCHVVKKRYDDVTRELLEKYNERDRLIREYPELESCPESGDLG